MKARDGTSMRKYAPLLPVPNDASVEIVARLFKISTCFAPLFSLLCGY